MVDSITLHYYQEESVDAVFGYFETKAGNPLIVLPTGSGKSYALSAFIKKAIHKYPGTRILVLTHVKELIEQDARAIINYWPDVPIGIWSAGVGRKDKDQVTVAGIQSIHRLPAKFADTALVIVDEAHLIPRKSDTMYRKFLDALLKYNPHLKVIGLTATEYRTDSGLLCEGDDRIFTDVAYNANVGTLIKEGYLCPLVMKGGATKADLSQVHTRGGDYIPGEAQKAMDHHHLIEGALDEVALYAADRNHVLGFCAGVEHAYHCMAAARLRGWSADYVHGEMSIGQRDHVISSFKEGRIRFLFNANILTTGFDSPHVDCIVMLRPTKSTGLYVQIMGRGLRKHKDKTNTLVLDFVGAVAQHGPIDSIVVKSKRKKGEDSISVAPVKECPKCHELVHASIMVCPGADCDYEWPSSAKHGTEAADGVIVAALAVPVKYAVDSINYTLHVKDDRKSVSVEYWCGLKQFKEWIPINNPKAHKHAVAWAWKRGMVCPDTVEEFLALADAGRVPAAKTVTVKLDGKYWRVLDAEIDFATTEKVATV